MLTECRHIMPGGRRCGSPALRGGLYCYFHTRLRRRVDPKLSRGPSDPPPPLQIPVLEDRSAIQLLIPDVLNAMLSKQIDVKSAAILLNGMRLAAQNADRSNLAGWERTVDVFGRTPEGDELAINEEEFNDTYEFDEGELCGIDDREYPELPEPNPGGNLQLIHSTAVPAQFPAAQSADAQSAEACSAAGVPAAAPPLVSAR